MSHVNAARPFSPHQGGGRQQHVETTHRGTERGDTFNRHTSDTYPVAPTREHSSRDSSSSSSVNVTSSVHHVPALPKGKGAPFCPPVLLFFAVFELVHAETNGALNHGEPCPSSRRQNGKCPVFMIKALWTVTERSPVRRHTFVHSIGIGGPVSCSRTLQLVDCKGQGSNQLSLM